MININSGVLKETSMIDTIYKIRYQKILLIASFVIILLCLYAIFNNHGVQGYEISIYEVYPLYSFWYPLILSIFIFHIILILNISNKSNSSISWKIAINGLVMANSIVLLLPLIRRYSLMGSGDPATHMGYIKDILYTGCIGANTYPMNHILACITHWISGFDLNICMMLYPFIFYSLYTVSFYLLLTTFLKCRTSVLVGMMLVPLLLLGGSHFTPQAESNFFLPFVFLIFFLRYSGENGLNNSILMIICSFAIAFYHPLTTLFLIISFSVIESLYIIYERFVINLDPNIRDSSYIIMILTINFFIWQSYSSLFLGTFRDVYRWLYEESTKSSIFETYSEQMAIYQPDPVYLITSIIYVYGKGLLLIFMGLISISIMMYDRFKNKKNIDINYMAFSIVFIICALFGYSSLFIVTGTGYGRVLTYAFFISIFLISISVGDILEKYNETLCSLKFLVIFSIILLILTYLSIFTLYHSPIIKSIGQQVTDSQITGINTFFEIRNENFNVLEAGLSVKRMKDALYGTRKGLKNIMYITPKIPAHFGYNNTTTHFGSYYGPKPMYLAINTPFRILNQALIPDYPERWKFSQMDFIMLENDVTISKIYSNREMDIYLLNANLRSLL